MDDAITIRIEGQHGSISDLKWHDVPPFALITGVNGTGKSQLLEVIAASYGIALRPDSFGIPTLQVNAKAYIEGASFAPGEVFHTYGEWGQLVGGATIQEDVREAIKTLYNHAMAPAAPGLSYPGTDPSQRYPPIARDVAARAGISAEDVAGLSLEEFADNLTPALLWGHMEAAPRLRRHRTWLFSFSPTRCSSGTPRIARGALGRRSLTSMGNHPGNY